jgi:hypothetical protein
MTSYDPGFDLDEHVRRYRLCQAGFLLIAMGMLLRCVDVGLHLGVFFSLRGMALINILEGLWYAQGVLAPMVLAMVMGPYLLWARWSEPAWLRATGLLVMVGLIDLLLWFLKYGDALGFQVGDVGHTWLRLHAARAVSWIQLGMSATLVGLFLDHLGHHREANRTRSIRGFLTAGLAIWILYFLQQTDWSAGWPLNQRPLRPLSLILLSAYLLPLTIAGIQVLALCLFSYRQAGALVNELRSHHTESVLSPLRSRSETSDSFLSDD